MAEKIFLKDYRSPAFAIKSVELSYDIYESETIVCNQMVLQRLTEGEDLVLDGHDFELQSFKLNGQDLELSHHEKTEEQFRIVSDILPEEFTIDIQTRLEPHKNKSYEGLYQSGEVLVTQNEAQGFRKITYFLDRPDVLTLFKTRVSADMKRFPVLLANGNLIEQGQEGERHFVVWEDPFKKPSYLHAIVAGDLGCIEDEFVTASGRKVDLKIYATKGLEPRCLFAMDALKLSMKWDEECYGREYDLDIYMIVAVDNFNAGAMENKGLNIFNSSCILADSQTATDDDYQKILAVIAHEYFHNWTGNRVTLRDWFQLSLKEGLTVFRDQEFSADHLSRGVQRIADVNALRTRQFAEDAGPTAHPVRPESVISVDNFFTTTIYEKGAELIRMLQALVGRDGFRKGMDLYFERHDGQAVTTDDFVKSMEDANLKDFSQFRRWYSQAGTPAVKVQTNYDSLAKTYSLQIQQSCQSTPGQEKKEVFHIPFKVALLNSKGEEMPLQLRGERLNSRVTERTLDLRSEEQTFVFEDVIERPCPSLLREFSAPVKLEMDYSEEDLSFLMSHETDSFNRWEACQKSSIQKVLEAIQHESPVSFLEKNTEQYVKGFAGIFRDFDADHSLTALLLELPSESYISQFVQTINVDSIHLAHEFLYRRVAETYHGNLVEMFHALDKDNGEYKTDSASMGRRALRNQCLRLLCLSADEEFINRAWEQLKNPSNMTDEVAALSILTQRNAESRDAAADVFYKRWKHDSLVINKLLRTISMAPHADTLELVRSYMKKEVFDIDNPNNVYALLMGFGGLNPTQFHRESGEGYEFMADQILDIDRRNPHVGAYLASTFNHWKRFDENRKGLMHKQLKRVIGSGPLSRNSYEIISKNLDI